LPAGKPHPLGGGGIEVLDTVRCQLFDF